jgi:2-haloacid dehalogenase
MSELAELAPNLELITFDCYGTLIDWEAGISDALRALGAPADRQREIVDAYVCTEAAIEQQGYRPYREILSAAQAALARDFGLNIAEDQHDALARSLPTWPPFADTNDALKRLKQRFRLGILSNIDRDLFEETSKHFDVAFDLVVTADDVESYKPAHPHFLQMLGRVGGPWHVLHVAQSLYHDAGPAAELKLNYVWINRYGGTAGEGVPMLAEFATLAEFADAMGV